MSTFWIKLISAYSSFEFGLRILVWAHEGLSTFVELTDFSNRNSCPFHILEMKLQNLHCIEFNKLAYLNWNLCCTSMETIFAWCIRQWIFVNFEQIPTINSDIYNIEQIFRYQFFAFLAWVTIFNSLIFSFLSICCNFCSFIEHLLPFP